MSYFDPHLNGHDLSITVVGLGGTGSILARHVARMIWDMRQRRLQTPKSIHFVDPDVVEMKNVGRQMFTVADEGQHKAEVLARRFNAALGLNIHWHNETFKGDRRGIILGAVDNHEARKAIAECTNAVWIDSGNHFDSGQVVIGNAHTASLVQFPDKDEWRYLPFPSLVFPQLLEPEPAAPQPDLSCADLMQMGEQHLLINDLMATIAAQYLYKLLHRQAIESFMTFVDSSAMSMRSIPINKENIETYLRVKVERGIDDDEVDDEPYPYGPLDDDFEDDEYDE